jgi:hypothetical protein
MGTDGPDGFLPYAPLDQRVDQPQGLTYTTPPLSAPLPLTGPSEFRFWAITEASDMAWVGRLIDVAPDGSTSLITQGWLRASFRYVDPARSRPGAPYLPDDRVLGVTVGLPTEYRMDIWDTAYTLAPGHRLRLWLSSSDTPTHEPLAVAGRNLILHNSDYPSQLLLGTRLPGPPCTAGSSCSPASGFTAAPGCYARSGFSVSLPAGMRRLRAVADGHRLRIARRAGSAVALVHPRARDSVVVVRIRGTDASGHRVSVARRYALCGSPATRTPHRRAR